MMQDFDFLYISATLWAVIWKYSDADCNGGRTDIMLEG